MIRHATMALAMTLALAGTADAQRYNARHRLSPLKTGAPEPTPTPTPPSSLREETSIVVHVISGSDCIQIAELEVYAGGVNVAAAANGGQASGTAPYDPASNASRAIDGVKPAGYPNIYHSICQAGSEFRVSFARPVDVERVVVYGRADSYGHRDLFSYEITGRAGTRTGVLDARSGSASSIPS